MALRMYLHGSKIIMNNDNSVLREILRRTEESTSFFVGRTKYPVAMIVDWTNSKMGLIFSGISNSKNRNMIPRKIDVMFILLFWCASMKNDTSDTIIIKRK